MRESSIRGCARVQQRVPVCVSVSVSKRDTKIERKSMHFQERESMYLSVGMKDTTSKSVCVRV